MVHHAPHEKKGTEKACSGRIALPRAWRPLPGRCHVSTRPFLTGSGAACCRGGAGGQGVVMQDALHYLERVGVLIFIRIFMPSSSSLQDPLPFSMPHPLCRCKETPLGSKRGPGGRNMTEGCGSCPVNPRLLRCSRSLRTVKTCT